MEILLDTTIRTRKHVLSFTLAGGIAWGMIGGLAGTMVMDCVLMSALWALGMPAFTCFSIVGNTAARFLSMLNSEISGGVPAGVAVHYLVGPLVGAIFGAVVINRPRLKINTLQRSAMLSVVYVEILSQPILVTTPILLNMTAFETLQWFGGSFVMHFLWGVILGVVVWHGCLKTAGRG